MRRTHNETANLTKFANIVKMAKFYMARQLKMSSEEETANCMKFAKSQTFVQVVTLVQMKFQEALLDNRV